jgi:hypothetical protein
LLLLTGSLQIFVELLGSLLKRRTDGEASHPRKCPDEFQLPMNFGFIV